MIAPLRCSVARPRLTLGAALLLLLAALFPLRGLQVDAALRELALDDEPALQLEQQWAERFGDAAYLIVLFRPDGDLLAPASLAALDRLQGELQALPGVMGVASLLDAEASAPGPTELTDLLSGDYPTLRQQPPTGPAARTALLTHPLHQERIIGRSGVHTTLHVTLANGTEAVSMAPVIRALLQRHGATGTFWLAGEGAIAADLVALAAGEMVWLGLAVVAVVIAALLLWLRHPLWPLLWLAASAAACLPPLLWLVWQQRPLTPLLLTLPPLLGLLALQYCIHLAGLYRTVAGSPQQRLALAWRRWLPGAAAGAMVAALLFSLLRLAPVGALAELGTLLAVGAPLGFLALALLAPALLSLWPPAALSAPLPPLFSRRRAHALSLLGLLLLGALVVLPQLRPALSLADYFRAGSEPRQTLALLDTEFGGSELLQLVLERPARSAAPLADEADPFAFDDFAEPAQQAPAWWFRRAGLAQLAAAEAVLMAQPAVGRVTSLTTLQRVMALQLGHEPGEIELALAQRQLPALPRRMLLDPFLDGEGQYARLLAQLRSEALVAPTAAIRELEDRIEVALGLAPEQLQAGGLALAHQRLQAALPGMGAHLLGLALLLQALFGLIWWRSPRAALWLPLPGLSGALLALGTMAAAGAAVTVSTLALLFGLLAIGGACAAQRLQGSAAAGVALLPAAVALPLLAFATLVPAQQFGLFGGLGLAAIAATALLLPAPRLLPLPDNDLRTDP